VGHTLKNGTPLVRNTRDAEVVQFFQSLTVEEREVFIKAIAKFTDLAFFSLVSTLEQGEGVYDFELFMRNDQAGLRMDILKCNEDLELKLKYFDWVEQYGFH
jgi:hypothetical protein